jgi:hypothetical protein
MNQENQNTNVNESLDGASTAKTDLSVSRSGGPRTPKGKERSRDNAVKHGIFSRVVVLEGEPATEYDALLKGFWDAVNPQGELEEHLVDRMATSAWRQRRLLVMEAERRPRTFAESLVPTDQSAVPSLELSLRYESSFERSFDRALSQLERLQRMRSGQPVLPELNVNLRG